MLEEGKEYKVCWFIDEDGNSQIFDFLEELKATDKKSMAKAVAGMRQLSDKRRHVMPHTRPLKLKGVSVFELRIIAGRRSHYVRIPFVLTKTREVVLLFGEIKKGASPTPSFLRRAADLGKVLLEKDVNYEEIDLGE